MKLTRNDPLLEAWETILREEGDDRPAIFDTQGTVTRTFWEIEDESRRFEDELLCSLTGGDVVAIQVGNHPAWPALLLASLRRGLVTLPLERSMAEPEREVALRICQAAGVVEITQTSDPNNDPIKLRPLRHDSIDWKRDLPVLLKLTSGTTAAPRAICFRSGQLLADCLQICQTMGIAPGDLNFAVIPLSHSYGFSNLITPLLASGVAMVLSQDRMPRAVLGDLVRSGATLFPGTPVLYQALSEMTNVPSLQKLRLCISAGAPLPLETAKKFRAKFQQSIHSFYGASECGGICYDRDALLEEEGFVGPPMHGVVIKSVDPDSQASRVRVRSAAVGDRYFPEPDEEKLGSGEFFPDDLLTSAQDGFRIVGRTSDLINVAGRKVNPAEVEAQLLQFSGVRAAVVFGRESNRRNEEVAACVVAGDGIDEATLLEFCRKRLSGWQVPKRIFLVDEIPTGERGKISRRDLAGRFRG